MARQRRSQAVNSEGKEKSTNSSSSNGSNFGAKTKPKTNGSLLSYWKHVIGFACFVVAATVGYMGYLETRVNTPFDDKKVMIYVRNREAVYSFIFILCLDGCTKWFRHTTALLGNL